MKKKISIDEIKLDDIIICQSFEKIAVDGTVTTGRTYVDESFITGESQPVLKEKGSNVIVGSINYNGLIEYQAKKIGKDSTISEVIKLVLEASNSKNKIQRVADKISSYFVWGIIIIAIITIIIGILLNLPLNEILERFTTVLVVACPCSLVFDVPLVVVIANGICAKKGLLIKNSEVLEKALTIDTIVFDKTGTLTYGKLKIHKLFNYSNYSNAELLNIVGNIERKSTRSIQTAFKIRQNLKVENFYTINGMGLKATIADNEYYLGNTKMLNKLNISNSKNKDFIKLTNDGCSVIYVIENKKIIALIDVKDIIRKEFKLAINDLKKQNIQVIMLTGDNNKTASIIGKNLEIDKIYANVLPKDKANIIKNLINNNQKVIMVGDGINDAPDLMNSTIGVSVNDGTAIANYSSEIILMNNNISNISYIINLSKTAYKIMLENLFWAFLYNVCMIAIALDLLKSFGIRLNPMFASIAMTISSLTVVLNSLRLNKIRRERLK